MREVIFKTIFISLIFFVSCYAQLSISERNINFLQVQTGSISNVSFYLINNSRFKTDSIFFKNYNERFIVSDSSFIIRPNDSLKITAYYKPFQNVIDEDIFIFQTKDSANAAAMYVYGLGKFNDLYDSLTFNLYDFQLKSALTKFVSGHTSLGYNSARDEMFINIDNQKTNGMNASQNTLECVYTGRLAVGYTSRSDAQINYSFNTEHTWPQSNFNENEPMKSDLYHLYPTDNNANSKRANYPFGNVVNITWQEGGSKLGTDSNGRTIYEPRDIHKGDVSRSMFYFITCYPQNYGGFLDESQENIFRIWNKLDTVSVKERNRNEAIAKLQKNRNPFIDHPEFVDRIFNFRTNEERSKAALFEAVPGKIIFDSTSISDTSKMNLVLYNPGNGTLNISSFTVSKTEFEIINSISVIKPFGLDTVQILFHPQTKDINDALLTIISDGGNKEIKLIGNVKNSITAIENVSEVLSNFNLSQNYPNPFNPTTKIKYSISASPNFPNDVVLVQLKIYDILGKEVETLINGEKKSGTYETIFNGNNLSSGIYFYTIRVSISNNELYSSTKAMILLK